MTQCPNCSANLDGAYCSACGQPRIEPGDLSAGRFFHELTDEVATLHLKFKTIRSLQALVRPGLLTAEYLAGRRRALLSDGAACRLHPRVAAERGIDPVVFSQQFDLRVYPGSLPSTLLKSAVLLVLTLAINYLADAGATRLTVGLV